MNLGCLRDRVAEQRALDALAGRFHRKTRGPRHRLDEGEPDFIPYTGLRHRVATSNLELRRQHVGRVSFPEVLEPALLAPVGKESHP
jgi:hypothetical protein